MINKILHHVYLGAEPPPEMEAFMATVMAVNPHWHRILWKVDNIHQLGLNYEELLAIFKKPVHVSDYVRLVAIEEFGGVYTDCDVEGVRSFDAITQYDAVAATQDGTGQICPAIFGACARHPWIKWQVQNAGKYSTPDSPWNVTLMTDAPRDGLTLVPTDTFYPWLWNAPKEDRRITENTLAIHHWKGSWAPWVIRDRT